MITSILASMDKDELTDQLKWGRDMIEYYEQEELYEDAAETLKDQLQIIAMLNDRFPDWNKP